MENGFINLGLGSEVETDLIKTINDIIYNYDLRLEMSNRMKNVDVRHGFENLMKIVKPKYLEFEKKKREKC